MTDTKSLAARVHGLLNTTVNGVWNGRMTPAEQSKLFGVKLVDHTVVVVVQLLQDSTIHTTAFDTDRTLRFAKTLDGIQEMVEARHDGDTGYEDCFDDDFNVDLYNTFPRDKSAFVTIENKALGRKEETISISLDNARENFARRQGYADWCEMRALAPAADREEDWVIGWSNGTPEECRLRTIANLEAEAEELASTLLHNDQASVGKAFLDKSAGLFDFTLKSRNPDAYAELEEKCHELRERHLELVEANHKAFDRWKEVQWLLRMYSDQAAA